MNVKTEKFLNGFSRNIPLLVLYLILLSVPCCLEWKGDTFHFAKMHLLCGFVSSIWIGIILTIISIYSRIAKYAISALLWILFFTEIFTFSHFHCRLNDRILYLIIQTNPTECSEFISEYLFRGATLISVLLAVAVAVLYYILRYFRRKINLHLHNRRVCVSLVVSMALSITFFILTFATSLFKAQSSNSTVVQVWIAASRMSNYSYDNERLEKAVENSDGKLKADAGDTPHIIFIIGESYNPNHSPLYGYKINTTPYMMEEYNKGNLTVFRDVVTPSMSTGNAMAILFSMAPPESSADRWDYPLVATIFRNAGYFVALHDNQSTRTSGDLLQDSFNCQFLNSDVVENRSIDYRNKELTAYDLEFVKSERRKVNVSYGTPLFEIYHLMGQHMPAEMRVPADFKSPEFDYSYRKDLTPEQKNDVRNYDIATYYNDKTISEIIKNISNEDAIVVYLSDHGEEVHDFRNQYGRTLEGITAGVANNVYRVPLIVYTTPKFRALHPSLYKSIQTASSRPVYSGDINQLLIHIGQIDTRYYRPYHDPLSPDYKSLGRRILSDEKDYDKLIREK